MAGETANQFARRMARQAFDAGLRAAGQPPAERDRRRTDTETYIASMLASTVENEVQRLQAAEVAS